MVLVNRPDQIAWGLGHGYPSNLMGSVNEYLAAFAAFSVFACSGCCITFLQPAEPEQVIRSRLPEQIDREALAGASKDSDEKPAPGRCLKRVMCDILPRPGCDSVTGIAPSGFAARPGIVR